MARPLARTYDKIGNRLTEVRGTVSAVTDTYSYVSNGTGHSPKLTTIGTSPGGALRTFAYDAIGDEARVFGAAAEEDRIFDDAGRLTRWVERTKNEGTTFRYDGRGFLRESKQDLAACNPLATFATYSSAGLLMHRKQTHGITAATNAEDYVLYFAGRPVAQLTSSPGPSKLTWLTTDHLGTPILSTLSNQSVSWSGGLEPFGRDWNGAQSAGVFLRFPGQWDDGSWSGVSGGGYHNVNRWYEAALGRYDRADPLGLRAGGRRPLNQLFGYAAAAPIINRDPLGLLNVAGCSAANKAAIETAVGRAKMALKNPLKDCQCKKAAPELLKHLDGATYYCVDNDPTILSMFNVSPGDCAGISNGKGVDGNSIALLVPLAFENADAKPGHCGCLEATILHEATHNVMNTNDFPGYQNNAYDATKSCISCAQ